MRFVIIIFNLVLLVCDLHILLFTSRPQVLICTTFCRLRTRLLKKVVAMPRTMRTATWMTWTVGFGLLKIEDGRLVAALMADALFSLLM